MAAQNQAIATEALVQELHKMFGVEIAICRRVVERVHGDEGKAVDELLSLANEPSLAAAYSSSSAPGPPASDDAQSEETQLQLKALLREKKTRALAASRYLRTKAEERGELPTIVPPSPVASTTSTTATSISALETEEERRLKEAGLLTAQLALKAEAKERRRSSAERRQFVEALGEEERWRQELQAKPASVDSLLHHALATTGPPEDDPEAESELDLAQLQRDATAYLQLSIKRAVEIGDNNVPSPQAASDSSADQDLPEVHTSVSQESNERLSILHSHFPELPLVSLYYSNDDDSSGAPERTNAILSKLKEAGVNVSDVQVVNLKQDYELTGFIKAKCADHSELPLALVHDRYLGTFSELEALSVTALKEKIDMVRVGKDAQSDSVSFPQRRAPSLGILDRALEKAESAFSWLNPFAWRRSSPSTSAKSDETVREFDVIHTNWYWRHLRRRFRFQEDVFMRIHSKHGDVRAAHRYSEVKEVRRPNPDSLVITYNTGASPDYLQGNVDDVTAMLAIFRAKNPAATFEDLTQSTLHM